LVLKHRHGRSDFLRFLLAERDLVAFGYERELALAGRGISGAGSKRYSSEHGGVSNATH
jgi:hypothetical protein